jgi:site-specific recombinase XerD
VGCRKAIEVLVEVMNEHSCGYKLFTDGHDTRAIQYYLGHRSIASTVRYIGKD